MVTIESAKSVIQSLDTKHFSLWIYALNQFVGMKQKQVISSPVPPFAQVSSFPDRAGGVV